jgi:hypothetical protein
MKTLAYNNHVIASDSKTIGSKSHGNLQEMTCELNQGDCFVDQVNRSNSNYSAPRNDSPNFLSRIVLFGLMMLLLSPLSFAQDFDADRMNRDIKIMEKVLEELFKIEYEPQKISAKTGSNSTNIPNVFTINSLRNNNKQVSGSYISGYGIIFKVPYLPSSYLSGASNIRYNYGERSISFYYDSNESLEDNLVTDEAVIQRITSFLKEYAPTIGQLTNDEQVTIVYGEKKDHSPTVRIFNLSGEKEEETEVDPIPVITVSTKASDLASLRSGRLSPGEFEDRLSISKKDGNEKERLDLNVMAKILSTAFEDGDDSAFHLVNTNSLSFVTIDGFGVHYTLDMHRGHGLRSISFSTLTNFGEADSKEADKAVKKIREARADRENILKTEYKNLIQQMKTYLVDYGRTLNSLKNDQFIIVSVNITDYQNLVPAQVNFQLKKSVLQELDRGQISRDEALNAVTISEF